MQKDCFLFKCLGLPPHIAPLFLLVCLMGLPTGAVAEQVTEVANTFYLLATSPADGVAVLKVDDSDLQTIAVGEAVADTPYRLNTVFIDRVQLTMQNGERDVLFVYQSEEGEPSRLQEFMDTMP